MQAKRDGVVGRLIVARVVIFVQLQLVRRAMKQVIEKDCDSCHLDQRRL
jgi:hypothetical protein